MMQSKIAEVGFMLIFMMLNPLASFADGLPLTRKMDELTASAMLNRFGYGATSSSLASAMRETPESYIRKAIEKPAALPDSVNKQLNSAMLAQPVETLWEQYKERASLDEKMSLDEKKQMQKEMRTYLESSVQGRMLMIANDDNQGHQVLLSFWLNHFSIYGPKRLDKVLAWDYARALEKAMREDSFEALLRASFYHPAMQIYLDNAQSTAPDSIVAQRAKERGKQAGINENLARELLELHTMGVDSGYTLKDIQALARIITGAGVYMPNMRTQMLAKAGATKKGLFLFDPRRHDDGEKVLLGERFPAGEGIAEIDRALHLLASQPATAKHIAFKLAQRFLSDEPPPALVEAMANAYQSSGGRISSTLKPLLASQAFADSLKAPAKFKEPLDYLISASRAVCGDATINNGLFLAITAQDMGQAPFMHTTPDGYGSKESDWLSPASMAKRLRLAMALAAGRAPLAAVEVRRVSMKKVTGNLDDAGLQGQACAVNAAQVERLVGSVSSTTQSAAQKLSE